MPATVDADERRRRLTEAAAELIADEGIGALTYQRIAERLDASTTVVTHYFRSKRELVLETYQNMASRSRARVEQDVSAASRWHAVAIAVRAFGTRWGCGGWYFVWVFVPGRSRLVAASAGRRPT